MFKRIITLLFFIFIAFFGVINNEPINTKISAPASICAPKTYENDIISQKNSSFSLSNITSRNTHLKNHHNTDGTCGTMCSNDVRYLDLILKQKLKQALNNKSLAQNFLLIQKLSNAPPRAV